MDVAWTRRNSACSASAAGARRRPPRRDRRPQSDIGCRCPRRAPPTTLQYSRYHRLNGDGYVRRMNSAALA
eukprot:5774059-Pleurochrysis_carterae.AAC.3